MKEFKKFGSFFSICLILSVALGNFSLPIVFTYAKDSVNFEQVRTEAIPNNSGTTFDKINSSSKEIKSFSSDSSITKKEKKNYVEGEILIKYKNTKINLETASGRASALNFISSKSLEKKEDLRKNNISVLKIKDSKTVEEKIAELKNDPNVEYVQPNFQYYPLSIDSNDTYKGLLWGLDNAGQEVNTISGTLDADIDAPEAWAISEGEENDVIVAVIDSGVAYNHPDLIVNMWDGSACVGEDVNGNPINGGCQHGYDYQDNDKIPLPTASSHGTHIAGTIAAVKNNNKGIIGVAPNAKIMAIKSSLTTSNVVKGIHFAEQNGAKVINASWGGQSFDQLLYDSINNFFGLFIAGAGNGGDDGIGDNNDGSHQYPSDYDLDNIISVAATDQNDNLASFSNYGAVSVDVGAPGTNIHSTVADSISFSENFETSNLHEIGTQFIAGGNTPSYWGVEQIGSQKALFTDDLFLPYIPYEFAYIESVNINLGQKKGAKLDFNVWCDTESTPPGSLYDFLGLKIYNGSTWTIVGFYHESLIAGWMGSPALSVNGYPGYLYQESLNISPYLSANNKIKFEWFTDSGNSDGSHLGCFIDELKITSYSDGLDEQYGYMQGTSMAAPHVAGLAALIEGYNPNLTTSEVKNIILTTGDDIPALHEKTSAGTRINAQKALQAANPAKTITAFSFAGLDPVVNGVINEETHTVALIVPFGTNVTALVPTIVINGASVNPASGVAQDFTNPVTYTVTAADGSTQAYVVTVTIATISDSDAVAADKAALVDDSIKGGNPDLSNITTVLTNPLPATGSNGSTITWASDKTGVVSNDGQTVVRPAFELGNDTVALTATLTKGVASDTKVFTLTVLKFPASTVATITSAIYTVSAGGTSAETITNVPFGTSKANFLAALAKGQADQTWNDTGIADPVVSTNTLVVTAQDGVTTVAYTVIVNLPPDTAAPVIDSFIIPETSNSLTVSISSFVAHDNVGVIGYMLTETSDIPSASDPSWSATVPSDYTFSTEGVKTLYAWAKDTAGNISLSLNDSVTITLPDTTAPVITLLGDNPVNLYVGDSYTDAGATALDDVDGYITVNIVVGGDTVDTGTVGTYIITYNVSDVAGNPATEVTRTVIVSEVPDNTPPTLAEVTPVPTPTNDNTPDYTFSSNETGTITYGGSCSSLTSATIAGNNTITFNALADGTYNNCTIKVTDAMDNESALLSVLAFTVDTTAPVIALIGENPQVIEVGTAYTELGATVSDNRPGSVITIDSSNVNTAVVGSYTVTYDAVDASGNHAVQVIRTVDVVAIPITLQSIAITHPADKLSYFVDESLDLTGLEVTGTYSDASTKVETITEANVTGFNSSIPITGQLLTITLNGKTTTYIVDVVAIPDTTAPIIAAHDDLVIGATSPDGTVVNYDTPVATDDIDGTFSATCSPVSGSTFTLGTTLVTCNASDVAGNAATPTIFNVTVEDKTPPVIALIGSLTINMAIGQTYTELGATATDNVDGDVTSHIIITGSIDTANAGTYYINYNVSDAAGNNAERKTRTVIVSALQIASEQKINISTNSTTIQWTTSHLATSRVLYDTISHPNPITDTAPNYGYANSTTENTTMVTDHSVIVDGLLSGTVYYMRPVSHGSPETLGDEITITTTTRSSGGGGGGGGGGGSPPVVVPSNISISINSDAANTNSQNVTLSLTATNAVQVIVSNSADFAGASWETYVASKDWTLLPENGIKIVYAKFRSSSGGTSGTVFDSIVLELPSEEPDTAAPQSFEETTPQGEVLGAVTYNFGLHSLIKTQDNPDVYAVFGNTKRKIRSLEIFNTYSDWWNNQNIEIVSQIYLDSLSDTTLIKTPGSPNVYILAKGFKRLLASVEIFNSYGLDWNKIVTIQQVEMDSYRVAPLIKHGVDLFWLDDGRVRHLFPSMESLTRNGYNTRDAIDVNDLELGSYANGIPINN